MRIHKVRISVDVERKIYNKHTVSRTELEEALMESAPLFFRAKEQRYLALAKKQRHLSIIFTFEHGTATIVTAYPSSDWQVKLCQNEGGRTIGQRPMACSLRSPPAPF